MVHWSSFSHDSSVGLLPIATFRLHNYCSFAFIFQFNIHDILWTRGPTMHNPTLRWVGFGTSGDKQSGIYKDVPYLVSLYRFHIQYWFFFFPPSPCVLHSEAHHCIGEFINLFKCRRNPFFFISKMYLILFLTEAKIVWSFSVLGPDTAHSLFKRF